MMVVLAHPDLYYEAILLYLPSCFTSLLTIFNTFLIKRPTVGVTRKWAGVDSVWEQKKLEARKMLLNRADSHLSGARCVRPHSWQIKPTDEKNVIGAEALNPAGKTTPPKKPADIMTRLRARRHHQKDHCQRNQPGVHDCQCTKNADRQTKLWKQKKPTD